MTISEDGSSFIWAVVKFNLGRFRIIEGFDENRGLPHGVAEGSNPPQALHLWAPTADEAHRILTEADAMSWATVEIHQPMVTVSGMHTAVLHYLPPLDDGAAAPDAGAPVLPVAVAPVVADGGHLAGAGGAAEAGGLEDLRQLRDAIDCLRSEMGGRASSSDSKKKKSKKSKKDRGRSSSSGRGRRRRRSQFSSSSSSRGGRSRSTP